MSNENQAPSKPVRDRAYWARLHVTADRREPVFLPAIRRPDCIIQAASCTVTIDRRKRAY